MPVWVGADRKNKWLQCLNPVGKPGISELQTLTAPGEVRQVLKKMVLQLEESAASHLCICGHKLPTLPAPRPGQLLIKRIAKNRGNKNELHGVLLQCCGELLLDQNGCGISSFVHHVGDRIDQIRCSYGSAPLFSLFQSLAEQQGPLTSFSVSFPKETALQELSSLPGWAVCPSYEKTGIYTLKSETGCSWAHAL